AVPAVDTAEILASLAQRLPAHMVPAVLVVVADLPRSPSGKVDRNALPATAAPPVEPAAPSSDLAQTLAVEFAALLELPSVGLDDSLFQLGGNSMTAVLLVARIEELFEIELPLRDVFDEPTPRALAVRVTNARR
ncbi:MAG TPA: phosphopantetheine-binding protein, partial [Kofleriaceae bacterium]